MIERIQIGRRAKPVLVMAFMAVLLLPFGHAPGSAQTGNPHDAPLLRLETGMHMAPVVRIGMDANERIIVSASHDKVARVWDKRTGRLLKVLRVPIGAGHEGELYALAVSPDGRTVAVGGFTDWNQEQGASIYLLDVQTGDMIKRITGLPAVILDLAFSRDGRYLAAAIGKNSGLWIFSATGWSVVAKDTEYAGQPKSIAFHHDGRIVTTSLDGSVRLYDKEFRLVSKFSPPGGHQPVSAVFSPDGQRIAVGFADSQQVNVLSGQDLSFLFSPDASGVNNGNMGRVAWSADGETLYAGGMWQAGDVFPVRAWRAAGRGSFKDLDGSRNTILHLLSVRSGGVAFGAGDPAVGVIEPNGEKSLYLTSSTADYRGGAPEFLVSPDGGTIRFGLAYGGKRPVLFSIATGSFSVLASESDGRSGLSAPVTQTQGLSVTDWEGNYQPSLNGKPLKMEEHEISRSLAISSGTRSLILGTEWYLRHFDYNGELRWKVPVPSVVWAVNVAEQAKLIVCALGDGTIRWYRMDTGKEVLAFFPRIKGNQWVAWTSSGYYSGSPGADELIGWHVNNGKDKAPDFFPASRFRALFNRPAVVEQILAVADETEAVKPVAQNPDKKTDPTTVEKILPPVVSILSPPDGTAVDSPEVKIQFAVRSPSGEPVGGVKLLVDGRPLSNSRGIRKNDQQTSDPEKGNTSEISVPIPEKDCEISIIADNRHSSSTPATVRVKYVAQQSQPQPGTETVLGPKLYVLAIGVGKYQNQELPQLTYPAKDAKDFCSALDGQKNKLYRDVVVKTLLDQEASRDGVLAGLEWIERETTSKDVAMVFI
ncbi:MAG: hypothetical protein ACLGPL_05615, partial [Acidobacteriota bacterium]